MKKPLFNEIQRQIMHEDKSVYASIMRLDVAKKKLENSFIKFVGRMMQKLSIGLNSTFY